MFWQPLHNSIQDVEGRVPLSQSARKKNPTKNNPTTTKTHLLLGSPHKRHKEWHKSTKLM